MKQIVEDYSLDILNIQKSFDIAAEEYDQFAILQHTVTDRLFESFEQFRINPALILDLGSGTGYGAKKLKERFKKAKTVQLDLSSSMLKKSRKKSSRFFSRDRFLCADAHNLPLSDKSVDLVFSSLMLQWCNDPAAVFSEIKRILKPEGLLLFSTFGPDSLKELRESWRAADEKIHVNAFIDMHDVGDALIRNGLDAPVLNVEHLVFTYDDCQALMKDLKNIGAQNINKGRRKTLTGKNRLMKMLNYYESFRKENKLPATYEIIYGHAWRPARESLLKTNDASIGLEDLKKQLTDHRKR